MNKTSDDPPLIDRIRSWARTNAHASNFNPFGRDEAALPVSETPATSKRGDKTAATNDSNLNGTRSKDTSSSNGVVDEKPPTGEPAAADATHAEGETGAAVKPNAFVRFYLVGKTIILSSWVNVLLVFVPVGLILGAMHSAQGDESSISPTIVFSINCIAIIPLAALLSFATESVASKMGDTVGALMNVTFGNAVELIIFIIALVAKEIRIVQASLLGSILSNLLLILGMCFLFGGLRFREQIYNATVTQMSACLLSLAVMSLLLPTAFHASFNDTGVADRAVLKVSRGTSVILLIIYVLYLLFQLKSHAFMYESTPQHIIDEESHPGVLADMLHSSSSSSDTSSSSSSDSDSSVGSHTTAKRIRRALTRRRHRKSSASSKEAPSLPSFGRTPSSTTNNAIDETSASRVTSPPHAMESLVSGDEADTEDARQHNYFNHNPDVTSRDFGETEHHRSGSVSKASTVEKSSRKQRKARKHEKRQQKKAAKEARAAEAADGVSALPESSTTQGGVRHAATDSSISSGPRVGFANNVEEAPAADTNPTRQTFLRSLSRPAMPKVLSQTVFSQSNQTGPSRGPPLNTNLNNNRTVRRTNSLPDRLNQHQQSATPTTPAYNPAAMQNLFPSKSVQVVGVDGEPDEKKHLSQTAAVVLLLISTGLVAACAEFLVDSIDYIVTDTGVSQTFIGLIILPIVGNAAEHVTAVTVASKNKMDLAINVSIGSSLQIALFVTPLVVLLGWCMDRDMTLYFSLFETVSLFVSAFIVNFLVLDGRSNYLEGSLLIAAYVIIAVMAFFYPSCADQNSSSGTGSC